MSQAYYDVEALESLLEERERDLELAARIGQTLLEKNRQLVDQVSNFTHLIWLADLSKNFPNPDFSVIRGLFMTVHSFCQLRQNDRLGSPYW